MIDLNFKYKELIKVLSDEAPFIADVALILGSGLGDFADSIEKLKTISTISLPGYPPSTIVGHEGKIHFCKFAEKINVFPARGILFLTFVFVRGCQAFYSLFNISK